MEGSLSNHGEEEKELDEIGEMSDGFRPIWENRDPAADQRTFFNWWSREFPIQLVDYCLTFLCDFLFFLKTQFRLKEGEEKLNDGLTELDA